MSDPSILISAQALRDLVTPIMAMADQGSSHPALGCVRFRTDGEYLTALATDRYRVGCKRAKVEIKGSVDAALVTVADLKRMLVIFKPARGETMQLRIEFSESRVYVSVDGTVGDFDARVGWPLFGGEFPKVDHVITDALSGDRTNVGTLAMDLRLLDALKPLMFSSPAEFFFNGERKAVGVSIEPDFVGAVMPAHRSPEVSPLPLASWTGILRDEKRSEAAA